MGSPEPYVQVRRWSVSRVVASMVGALLGLAVLATPVAAQPAAAEPDDDLTVSVLTFGPGEHPFFKFGHNAIWIQERNGRGVVYNFGTFAFDTPNLIGKFLQGRFQYWLSRSPIRETLYGYEASDRTIIVQELALDAAQKRGLRERLEVNARPENRAYLYDYFWDNCSTRVRDAIDVATGGRVKAAAQGPGRLTFRGQALRLVHDVPWEYFGLDLLLGSIIDQPRNEWEEGFIPEVFQATLRKVRIATATGVVPLVRSERVIYQSTKAPPPVNPPARVPLYLTVGVLFGGVWLGLGRLARSRWPARVALGALLALWGLVAGLVGLVMPLLWMFTNHRAAYANQNMLQLAPFVLAFLPLGVGVALGWRRATAWAAKLALVTAGLAAFGLVVGFVLPQDTARTVALFVPLWAGLALGLRELVRPAKIEV